MIKNIVHALIFKNSVRINNFLKAFQKIPKEDPLPITTGFCERLPVLKGFYHIVFPKSFKEVYARKQENLVKARLAALPSVEVSSQTKMLILSSTVTELLNLLNNDHITSQQILYTYMERSQSIGIEMNYITDLNIEEAFEQAKRCDEIRSQTPYEERKGLGLLFGVPISVKENIIQKGFDSTCGLAVHCFQPSPHDSIAIELIRKEGGIPFVRSTVPQLLSVIETVSYLWGKAHNPWNATRSTGGSSGGEAGLITTGCSPLGLGTDGLGSLRIPALWCGIYSFKPTTGRVNSKDSTLHLHYMSESRWNVLYPSIGPMGRSVDDLILLTKSLVAAENREKDPHYAFIEWRNKETKVNKKLKFGYVVSQDMYGSCKAVKRAMLEAVEELKSQGHEVEEIKIPGFNAIVRTALAVMTSDGASKGTMLALQGEELIEELKLRAYLSFIPKWLRRMTVGAIKALGHERPAYLGNWTAGLCGQQWLRLFHEKEQLEQQFFSFWRQKELDAIITPGTALPALRHGTSGELALNCCYLWVSNVLNLPSGVVPISRVQKEEAHYNRDDSKYGDLMYLQGVEAMKGSEGLPVGIQVLTLPYEDEKCLGIMKLFEKKFPPQLKL